jgi:hypothetical protein
MKLENPPGEGTTLVAQLPLPEHFEATELDLGANEAQG